MAGADLVTLAEVKQYAGINSTNQDTSISTLIPMVSAFVKNYCNRSFVDHYGTALVEVVSGGGSYIYLNEAPIRDITSVEYSVNFGATYAPLTPLVDYVHDVDADRIQALGFTNVSDYNSPPFVATIQNTPTFVSQPIFRKHPNGYRVTYRAGYPSVPSDLKLAVIDLVMYYQRNDMAVKSPKSTGSTTAAVEYITNANLPHHIRRVLDMYILAQH